MNNITKDFENASDKEIDKYSRQFKLLKSSWLDDLMSELTKRNINTDQIPLIKEELDWREQVREEVYSQKIDRKASWGFIPTLKHQTNWRISEDKLYIMSFYIIYVMFWDIGIGLRYKNGFNLARPDGIDGKSHAKIKLGIDKFGNLKVKCIATGDLIYDNERNIRSLTLFLKAFELIGKRENIIN